MSLSFPNSPSTNDTHVTGGSTWIFNGEMWVRQGTRGAQGIQGIQGTHGTQGLQGLQGNQGVQGLQGIIGVQVTAKTYTFTAVSGGGGYQLVKESYYFTTTTTGLSEDSRVNVSSSLQGAWSVSRPASGQTGYQTDLIITKSAGSYNGGMVGMIDIISNTDLYLVSIT
jgi:hypothetical protein